MLVGKLISRGWKLRTQWMACLLIVCLMASLLMPALLSVQQVTAAEAERPAEHTADGLQEASPADAPEITSPAGELQDVLPTDWFYDAVCYVLNNGIFNGTGEGRFTPRGTMTRAMYVTALGRMAGVDVSRYSGPGSSVFADVPADAWYAPYVAWAAEAGITGGTGGGMFSPETTITREQMATLLVRFYDLYRIPLPEVQSQDAAPADLEEISPWAADAVIKLWRAGLMVGDENGRFHPHQEATRAEAAVTFMRSDEAWAAWKEQNQEPETVDPEPKDGDTEDQAGEGEDASGGSGNSGGVNWPVYHMVTFDMDGGPSVPAQTVADGSKAVEPEDPVREGHTFGGWYSDSGYTQVYNFASKVYRDTTIHAKWTPNLYTVTFNSHGGSAVSSQKVHYGDSVREPDVPTRTKHTFEGWYSDSEMTSAYDFSAAVTGDLTLHVKWIENFTVTFDSNGGTSVTARTVQDGKSLGSLPVPTKDGYIFQGWYSDSGFTQIFSENSLVRSDLTLYARYMENIMQTATYTPVSSVMDVDAGFTIAVTDESGEMTQDEVLESIIFEDISDPDAPGIRVTGGAGSFILTSAAEDGRFGEGNTYRLTLEDERLTFAGLDASTRIYVFSVAKEEALSVPLNPDMIYLPFADIRDMMLDGEEVDSPAIPILSSTAGGGEGDDAASLDEANAGSGTFTYTGSEVLKVGDVVAIYEGVRPDRRTVETDGLEDGDIAYVEITQTNGTSYAYRAANSKQVLFRPDILPVSVLADQDGDDANLVIQVEVEMMDYSNNIYLPYGLSELTTVDVNDFIGFYEGTFDTPDMDIVGYGLITSVTFAAEWIYIEYEEVTFEDIEHAFNIYARHAIDGDMLLSDEDIARLEDQIEEQARASGFVDEAVSYLTALAMETKSVKAYEVSIAEVSKVSVRNLTIVPSVNRSPRYIPGLDEGISATLQVGADIVIQMNEDSSLVIHLTGTFLQEIGLSINVDGDLQGHWKTKYIWPVGDVPYWYVIDDYVVTANLDAYTYTGINIEAGIATVERDKLEEVLWDWKNSRNTAILLNIASEIEALLEGAEYTPVDANVLKTKYQEMLKNETEWVPLIKKKLVEKSFRVALGAVEIKFEAEMVVRVNANLTLGIDFNYKTAKRYSVTMYVWGERGTKDTVSLPGDEDYQLTFYVLGTLGLKAGVNMQLKAGVGSVKLNSVGLTAEPGAYLQMWGYFYYQLVQRNMEKISRAAGALLMEMGLYLDIAIGAQLGDGLLSGNIPVYEEQWPLLSIGSEAIVDDFAYAQEGAPAFNLAGRTTSMALPDSLFAMSTFHLKTGHIGKEVYDLSRFEIQVDNPDFRFHADTRKIEVVNPELTVAEGNLVITWKGAPLTFSYEPIKRTIPLLWLSREGDYILQLDPRNGDMTQVSSLAYNAPISVTTPERPGYTFVGWYTEPTGGTEEDIPDQMPARDITLYARWVANTDTPYTVEHYWVNPNARGEPTLVHTETRYGTTDTEIRFTSDLYNGDGYTPGSVSGLTIKGDGSTVVRVEYFPTNRTMTFDWGYDGAPASSITDQFGKNIASRIPQPTRAGYIFTGWSPDVPATVPTVDVTYEAQWEARQDTLYQVVYLQQNINSNSHTVVDKERYRGTTDQLAQVAEDMEREYEGFRLDKSIEGTVLNAHVAGDGSTVLKLYYTRDAHKLTIRYEHPDLRDVETDVPYGATISLYFGAPTRTGYTFTGWSPAPPATMPAGDLVVTAQWELNTYAVSFDTGTDAAIQPQTVGYGSQATEPDEPVRNGYSFVGWYVNLTDTRPYDFATPITNHLALHAKWLARYTVSFETGEGSTVDPVTVNEGETLTPPVQPVREGYVFGGWYADEALTTPYDIAHAEITGDLTLYAKWTEVVKTRYKVSFIPGNGTVMEDQEVIEGAVAQKPADPALEGYTFRGWYLDSGYTRSYGFNEEVTENITLYAKWERSRYTISFSNTGGAVVPDQTVDYGSHAIAPVEPTWAGYRFLSWFTDISSNSPYGFNETVTGDLTLYAKWVVVHTVSFDTDGGSEVPSSTVDYGSAAEAPPAPTKSGYRFDGWFTADDQSYNFATPVTGDITLYAKWTRNAHTVTFISMGSTLTTRTVIPGEQVTPPELPDQEAYQFDGWYTELNGSTRYDFANPVNADITLYARWTLSPWHKMGDVGSNTISDRSKIVFDSNGTPYIAYAELRYSPDYDYLEGINVHLKKYVNGAWQDVALPAVVDQLDPLYTNFYLLLEFDSQDNLYWVLHADEDIEVYKLPRNSGTWEHIGTLGFDTSYEHPTSLVVDRNDQVYVAYTRNDDNTIVVEQYNGSAWKTLSGLEGLMASAMQPILGMGQNDVIYMSYMAYFDGSYHHLIAKLEDDVWESITPEAVLNAHQVTLSIGPDQLPYVAYSHDNRLTVIKYQGGAWETIVGTGFANVSMDSDSLLGLDFDHYGSMYVSYLDRAKDNKATVIKYEGVWSTWGNAGFSLGMPIYLGISVDPGGTVYAYYIDETRNPPEAFMFYDGELIIKMYAP